MPGDERRYKWGRSRIQHIPTMRIAVPVGIVLSVAVAFVRLYLVNPDGPYRWIAALIFALCLSPFGVCLVAVLIVDRSTMPGAVENPEASVESVWYARAASAGFHTTLVVSGLGIAFADKFFSRDVMWALVVVWAINACAFGVSYLVQRFR